MIPHGLQANQFKYYVKWGMTPAQALQTAYLTGREDAELRLGGAHRQIEKGSSPT